jgi:N utilization substance protein A
VGVRGNRIKNIVDELAGERIDIVRYNDDPQVLITNALQPAEIEEVILCQMMGRAIVLVREDQLSLAIGRRGQNVRLASKLCGWDIEIMTREELEEQIERAVLAFSSMEGLSDELAEALVGEGYLSYDDLSVIEPDALMEMGGVTMEQADAIMNLAEEKAEEAEQAAASERRRQRERERESGEKTSGESAEGAEQSPAAEAVDQTGQQADDTVVESAPPEVPESGDVSEEPLPEPVEAAEPVAEEPPAGEAGSEPAESLDEASDAASPEPGADSAPAVDGESTDVEPAQREAGDAASG